MSDQSNIRMRDSALKPAPVNGEYARDAADSVGSGGNERKNSPSPEYSFDKFFTKNKNETVLIPKGMTVNDEGVLMREIRPANLQDIIKTREPYPGPSFGSGYDSVPVDSSYGNTEVLNNEESNFEMSLAQLEIYLTISANFFKKRSTDRAESKAKSAIPIESVTMPEDKLLEKKEVLIEDGVCIENIRTGDTDMYFAIEDLMRDDLYAYGQVKNPSDIPSHLSLSLNLDSVDSGKKEAVQNVVKSIFEDNKNLKPGIVKGQRTGILSLCHNTELIQNAYEEKKKDDPSLPPFKDVFVINELGQIVMKNSFLVNKDTDTTRLVSDNAYFSSRASRLD
jgi:hypothetical protein